jgi:hypothetical protein
MVVDMVVDMVVVYCFDYPLVRRELPQLAGVGSASQHRDRGTAPVILI